jgi:hypothetical protein
MHGSITPNVKWRLGSGIFSAQGDKLSLVELLDLCTLIFIEEGLEEVQCHWDCLD